MNYSVAGKISDSEVEILRVLWESASPMTLAEVRTVLNTRTTWEDSTIKTLLRRLCEKGAVHQTKEKVFYYSAAITEAEYEKYCTQKLIDRLYKGSAKNLVAALVSEQKLTEEDMTELWALLKAGDADE